ncbi:Ca-activated chloride channel family protein [Luteibacter sp. UNCMF331Sha3.1]|uniref:vWA domain-containing protein n=1 Tax=Luteibacter sp. UNCMF331Sha3.1 TaxID=1502760 RepID=UPI0008AFDB4B|nr:VWA domain-containing protein [Luteibacter sp. UNCMF331Sha3.1]SEN35152.1 Ca-activated chloride channel family protein [Luteibacter sp. UNCMF331Sha3.1]
MNPKRVTLPLLFAGLVALAGAAAPDPASASQHAVTPDEPDASGDCVAGGGWQGRPMMSRMAGAPVAVAAPPPPAAPPATIEVQASAQAAVAAKSAPMPMAASVLGFAPPMPYAAADRDNYAHREPNGVHLAASDPVSTFGLDVDTGSYTNVRHMISEGRLPPADAVRTEEFINYFDYGYAKPTSTDRPFSITTELAPAPWNPDRQLLLVGVQGYDVPAARIPAANLVFLVDVSGSMNSPDKLPLLKASLKQIVPKLRAQDRISLVTYAGATCVALRSTPGDRQATILAAIDGLGAGGSTNGAAGIDLAYAQAAKGFIPHGVNRVILATDGDFNVGTTGVEALKDRIVQKRRGGVALTTLGFGEGNYNDEMAVTLADAGNGSHHYIDSLDEGRRVLVDEMSATLMTIAKDVKVQVEFNPAVVAEYRLIGYEKRVLAREDFNNDAVDAGDIGAGANVTALYEITLKNTKGARVDPLRYGPPHRLVASASGADGELGFLRVRYKSPEGGASRLIEQPMTTDVAANPSERLRFAAAVAAFAENLRGGKYAEGFGYDKVAELARGARGADDGGYRAGMVRLVEMAGAMP